MAAVVSAVKDIGNAIGDVVSSVGNAIEDVGDFIVDDILKPVAKTVEKTIEAAAKDPIGTIAKIATAVYAPYLLPATNAAVALANGASPEDALKSAALTYVAQGVSQAVGSYIKPELTQALPDSPILTNALTRAAGSTAAAVATGQDPTNALVSSVSFSTAGEIAKEIPGFEDLSKTQKNAAVSAISATIQGRDPTQVLVNEAIANGIDAAKGALTPGSKYANSSYHDPVYGDLADEYANAPQTVEDLNKDLFADASNEAGDLSGLFPDSNLEQTDLGSLPELPNLSTTSPPGEAEASITEAETPPKDAEVGTAAEEKLSDQALFNTELRDFYESIGLDPESVSKASETTEDPIDLYSQAHYEQFVRDWYESAGIDPDSVAATDPVGEDPFAYKSSDPIASKEISYGQLFKSLIPRNVAAQQNTPFNFSQSNIMPLLQNAALYGGAAVAIDSLLDENGNPVTSEPVPDQYLSWNQTHPTNPEDGVAYGETQLNPTYAANGGLMSLARGGISTLGGYSDGGRLLKGPGDGMSDNIPAMIGRKQPARLADGEFVIPADVVSHLGNGSTEAGANVLYKMMDKVRRARTGNSKQGKQINPNKFIPS